MSQKVRLVALDILRGFFLFVIIVDHVELFPSFFDLFSGRGRMWVSAAEGFFFISGLLVGFIYRKKLVRGFGFICKKLWQRAALLYGVSIILTLLFTYMAVTFGGQAIKYGLPVAINWPEIIITTLTLQYSFGWADFLPHYVIFIIWSPFALYLLVKKKWWLLGLASIALWFGRGQDFTMAWQLLFVGGMMLGYYWENTQMWLMALRPAVKIAMRRSIFVLAGLTFAYSYMSVFILSELNTARDQLPSWLVNFTIAWDFINTATWPFFEKWTLEPGRIFVFGLWFAAAYLFLEQYGRYLPRLIGQALLLLGRNSLFVYGLHSVVIFVLHMIVTVRLPISINFLITGIVLVVIIAITWLKVSRLKPLNLPRLIKFSPQAEKE